MNKLEKQMVSHLRMLRDEYGCLGAKGEFESEAMTEEELILLRRIVSEAGDDLDLVMKSGGSEAITDMQIFTKIGVSGIVAPMVESPYSLYKFLASVEKFIPEDVRGDLEFAVNIETKFACENFAEMLRLPNIHLLGRVTIGRVDLTGSMGLSREAVNCDAVYQLARQVFTLARGADIATTMGGGIAKEAVGFISRLAEDYLLDHYETRKIIFAIPEDADFNPEMAVKGIVEANRFELMWLENKARFHGQIASQEAARVEMLRKRIDLG